jgi:outer membrane murein-binding lipoprotein Lpp
MTVFSMVGFVSLSGYSSEAKNAKVTSDITTIQR